MRAHSLAATLIAGIVAAVATPGHAEADQIGRFQIAAQANTGNVWVVDTITGKVRLCQPRSKEEIIPNCHPWSGRQTPRTMSYEEATKSK